MSIKPPIKGLPSFLVNATLLGFAYYLDDALCLLRLLSVNASLYAVEHQLILVEFCAASPVLRYRSFMLQEGAL